MTYQPVESLRLNVSTGYRTEDDGKKLYGKLDNNLWSLAAAYSIGPNKFTIAHQRILLFAAQSLGVMRFGVQPEPDEEAQEHRRHAFDDVHPLPAITAQARCNASIVFEQELPLNR